jgi:hypothetical protein
MDRSSNRHDETGVTRWANEDRSGLLRLVLKLDAAACGALGVASLVGAPFWTTCWAFRSSCWRR